MSAGDTNEQDKRALYWLGERLIDYRNPIMIVVLVVTAVFAYWAFQLKLETSFGDLLPQTHPFIQIHNKYAGTFGGANNVQLMVEVKDGDIFTVPTLARIYKITEARRSGLRRQPQPDRLDRPSHHALPARAVRRLPARRAGHDRTRRRRPRTPATIRRIVHNTESIYGILVSLDDKAALVRANFIEGRLDHRRTFTEFNERVIAPFEKGWFGALIKGKDPLKPDQPTPATIEAVYRGTRGGGCRAQGGRRHRLGRTAPRPPTAPRWRRSSATMPRGSEATLGHQARRRPGDREDQGAGARHRHLRRRRAAPLRLGLQLRRRRLLDLHRDLVLRVGAALDVLPRLARRAAADAHRRHRGLLGARLHPPDRLRARPAHPGDAVPHHGARREPRHPDARPLLRGVRAQRLGPAQGHRRGVRRAVRADLLGHH